MRMKSPRLCLLASVSALLLVSCGKKPSPTTAPEERDRGDLLRDSPAEPIPSDTATAPQLDVTAPDQRDAPLDMGEKTEEVEAPPAHSVAAAEAPALAEASDLPAEHIPPPDAPAEGPAAPTETETQALRTETKPDAGAAAPAAAPEKPPLRDLTPDVLAGRWEGRIGQEAECVLAFPRDKRHTAIVFVRDKDKVVFGVRAYYIDPDTKAVVFSTDEPTESLTVTMDTPDAIRIQSAIHDGSDPQAGIDMTLARAWQRH